MKFFKALLLLISIAFRFQISYSQECDATALYADHKKNDTTVISYSSHYPTSIWKTDVMLGRVIDKKTYKPIVGARIQLLNAIDQYETEVVTDEKGSFKIEKSDLIEMEHHFRILHPQYKCLTIFGYVLREDPQNVISITVKLKRNKQKR